MSGTADFTTSTPTFTQKVGDPTFTQKVGDPAGLVDYLATGINDAVNDTGSNAITGSKIGTDVIGSTAIPNRGDGVPFESGDGNTAGSFATDGSNVISGNGQNGVEFGGNTKFGVVINNKVGTKATATAGIPNGGSGVFITGTSSSNSIGESNILAYKTPVRDRGQHDGLGQHVHGQLDLRQLRRRDQPQPIDQRRPTAPDADREYLLPGADRDPGHLPSRPRRCLHSRDLHQSRHQPAGRDPVQNRDHPRQPQRFSTVLLYNPRHARTRHGPYGHSDQQH